ncbi:MAG: hypothetical protein ACRDV0_10695 [Acidimicrobiales bacterium]
MGGSKRRRIDGAASTSTVYTCDICNVNVSQNQKLAHERTLKHRTNSCLPVSRGVQVIHTAFKSRLVSYRVTSDKEHLDYSTFFDEIKSKVLNMIKEILCVRGTIKVNMVVVARYFLQSQDIFSEKSFNTSNAIVAVGSDLDDVYSSFVETMKVQSTEFQEKDSGVCKN